MTTQIIYSKEDITCQLEVMLIKTMVFLAVMVADVRATAKKAEPRIDVEL